MERCRHSGRSAEPLFDINSSQVESREYYDSAAQTPMEYSTMNSTWGGAGDLDATRASVSVLAGCLRENMCCHHCK